MGHEIREVQQEAANAVAQRRQSENWSAATYAQTIKFASAANNLIPLFGSKQHAYGPANISTFGLDGIVVRLTDKQQRLKRLVWDNLEAQHTEGVADTLLDMAVYAIIGLLLLQNEWDGA